MAPPWSGDDPVNERPVIVRSPSVTSKIDVVKLVTAKEEAPGPEIVRSSSMNIGPATGLSGIAPVMLKLMTSGPGLAFAAPTASRSDMKGSSNTTSTLVFTVYVAGVVDLPAIRKKNASVVGDRDFRLQFADDCGTHDGVKANDDRSCEDPFAYGVSPLTVRGDNPKCVWLLIRTQKKGTNGRLGHTEVDVTCWIGTPWSMASFSGIMALGEWRHGNACRF